jgi:hypothetical protein
MSLDIVKSHLANKKYDAIFSNYKGDIKIVSFGATGYSDYTIHKDKRRRELYINRHSKNEDWDNPLTAGSLSRWILWGDSVSLEINIKNFKRKFNLT